MSFAESRDLLRRLQAKSLFRVDEDTQLPVLRLSGSERSREFRSRAGRRWMRRCSVAFVATARNARLELPRAMRQIHRLGSLFKSYWLVFVENDSNDGTRLLLHDIRRRHNRTVILGCAPVNSEQECRLSIAYRSGKLHRPGWAQARSQSESRDRSTTMSALRNMYLQYVYTHLAGQVELMIALEADVSWQPWDLDSIAQGMFYLSTRPQLQLLCANARLWGKVYDPCSLTYFSRKQFAAPDQISGLLDVSDAEALEKNRLPVKVASCFQGFAVYRVSSLAEGPLWHLPAPGEWNCEHNTLARQLREVYIDPAMQLDIYSLTVHSRDRP